MSLYILTSQESKLLDLLILCLKPTCNIAIFEILTTPRGIAPCYKNLTMCKKPKHFAFILVLIWKLICWVLDYTSTLWRHSNFIGFEIDPLIFWTWVCEASLPKWQLWCKNSSGHPKSHVGDELRDDSRDRRWGGVNPWVKQGVCTLTVLHNSLHDSMPTDFVK